VTRRERLDKHRDAATNWYKRYPGPDGGFYVPSSVDHSPYGHSGWLRRFAHEIVGIGFAVSSGDCIRDAASGRRYSRGGLWATLEGDLLRALTRTEIH
jgi:hypothetical protein